MPRSKSKKETLLKPDKSARQNVVEPIVADVLANDNAAEVNPLDLIPSRVEVEPPAAIPVNLRARQLGHENAATLEFNREGSPVKREEKPLEFMRPAAVPVVAPAEKPKPVVVPEVIPNERYTLVRAPVGLFDTSPGVTMFRNLESAGNRQWVANYNKLIESGYEIADFAITNNEYVFLFVKK